MERTWGHPKEAAMKIEIKKIKDAGCHQDAQCRTLVR